MVWEGNFATEDECQKKAGSGYNSTDITTDVMNDFIAQAESFINVATRYNWIDGYTGLNADVKRILSEVASNLVGIYSISYDMSGYTSRIEAEDIINILRDGALRGISILRDKKAQEFMNDA